MYLYHYGFTKLPFGLTPDTELFCSLPSFKSALNTIQFALSSGEAICKVIGEVGAGKTMLCRWLIKQIGDQRTIAYIPHPVLSPKELKQTLASELKLRITSKTQEAQIVPKIQSKLIDINRKQGPVILIIDEAQALPDETLETLRLFTNLETETNKLLQVVLFGQPELDKKLSKTNLRQIKQRIAFSAQLKNLSYAESKSYINYRLTKVSSNALVSFSVFAEIFLIKSALGVPRLLNILSHKSLMLAYGAGRKKILVRDVFAAANDTEATTGTLRRLKWFIVAITSTFVSGSLYAWWLVV